jgi:hypothetical protein
MMNIETLAGLNWGDIESELSREGYALLPGLLEPSEVQKIARELALETEVITNQHADAEPYSQGRITALTSELPRTLRILREGCYEHLKSLASTWNDIMGTTASAGNQEDVNGDRVYGAVQTLGEHEYKALTQNPNTQFPVQLVMLLSDPDKDFTGGQFVMTEQRPRMQSRPMVVPLAIGDVALISTAHRPFKGSKGYYRVNMKHAVSRVRSGKRLGLELLLDQPPQVPAGE